MSTTRSLWISLLIASFSLLAWSEQPLREIKVAISNPSNEKRVAEDIVIPFAQLRQAAPEINAGSLLVKADDTELPSQVDDLDEDGKADELVFQINLQPKQTRTVTITYGEPGPIYSMRSEYPKRTYALFAKKIEGLGWESEENAWRLYFDPRNAIDLYGKRRNSMFLDIAATAEYAYHADTINGRDIFRVGNALGIGAVGAWVDGKLVKAADVSVRKWKIVADGPVRSIIEVSYEGWRIGGRSVTLRSRIEQWAGDRGFFHTITADSADGITFATGLTIHERAPAFRSKAGAAWLATYGEQVVETGPRPTQELTGTNLGLAIIFQVGGKTSAVQDDLNYLLTFPLDQNRARWYAAAAWDQEDMNSKPVLPAIKTQSAFLDWVKSRTNELTAPATVKILQ